MRFEKIVYVFLILLFSCNDRDPPNSPEKEEQDDPIVRMTDEELMDLVQKDVLKYFIDYAHPNSKFAKERYHTENPAYDANVVATGGTGFGFMSIIAGVNRGFISRQNAVAHLSQALSFLEEADRFHGAWPHWLDGNTGKVIPFFDPKDNGGDIIETAYLCVGLICIREYFKDGNAQEKALASKADILWRGVDFNWYTKEGKEDVIYWHWSPNYTWEKKIKVTGYNECLITYVLGASSPTHPISTAAYHKGWARNGGIKYSGSKYNIPIIFDHVLVDGNNVGPLFWAHYSYLGLDPNGLSDQYATNYLDVVKNHTLIQYNYCMENPKNYKDYGPKCWGLTSSYTRTINGDGSIGYGYTDHKPDNDRGVITPTAALSSIPYTPTESLRFLRYLYEDHKQSYVGYAGPYDAFSPHYNWVAKNYLAIDQGTIAPMIENYRTGLLWKLFMGSSEIKQGLKKLGFSSSKYGI